MVFLWFSYGFPRVSTNKLPLVKLKFAKFLSKNGRQHGSAVAQGLEHWSTGQETAMIKDD